jgi:hypothetical protein
MKRRTMLAGAAGMAAAAVAVPGRAAAATDPATRRVLLVGANPGVSLFTGEQLSAFASVWIVRWSERGSGRAIVLWHDGRVRVLATEHDAEPVRPVGERERPPYHQLVAAQLDGAVQAVQGGGEPGGTPFRCRSGSWWSDAPTDTRTNSLINLVGG